MPKFTRARVRRGGRRVRTRRGRTTRKKHRLSQKNKRRFNAAFNPMRAGLGGLATYAQRGRTLPFNMPPEIIVNFKKCWSFPITADAGPGTAEDVSYDMKFVDSKGWTTFNNFYDKYRLLSVGWEMRFVPTDGEARDLVVYVVPERNDGAGGVIAAYADTLEYDDLCSIPKQQHRFIPRFSTARARNGTRVMNYHCFPPSWFQRPVTDTTLAGLTDLIADIACSVYLHIGCLDPGGTNLTASQKYFDVYVTSKWKVQLYDRKEVIA